MHVVLISSVTSDRFRMSSSVSNNSSSGNEKPDKTDNAEVAPDNGEAEANKLTDEVFGQQVSEKPLSRGKRHIVRVPNNMNLQQF
ncbi:hypothetical protein Trydic_g17721 [Trypoxylus dichotomus]